MEVIYMTVFNPYTGNDNRKYLLCWLLQSTDTNGEALETETFTLSTVIWFSLLYHKMFFLMSLALGLGYVGRNQVPVHESLKMSCYWTDNILEKAQLHRTIICDTVVVLSEKPINSFWLENLTKLCYNLMRYKQANHTCDKEH